MVRGVLFLALAFFIISCDTVEDNTKKNNEEPYIVKHDTNYFMYSEQFAERFNLPSNGVTKLDDGLSAVGFHLKTDDEDPSLLRCILKLYIDSSLDVATPSKERGSRQRWNESSEAGFFMGPNTPKTEFEWAFDKYTTQSFNTLRVASKNLNKSGVPESLSDTGIASYDKEYLKGITYLSSDITCGTLESNSMPYEVHIKKKSYQGRFGPSTPGYDFESQPESLIRFGIPNRLTYAVLPTIEKDFEDFVKRTNAGLDEVSENDQDLQFIIPPMIDFSDN